MKSHEVQIYLNVSEINFCTLGSVAGPVIQANGRLTFEDDLRSGGPSVDMFEMITPA